MHEGVRLLLPEQAAAKPKAAKADKPVKAKKPAAPKAKKPAAAKPKVLHLPLVPGACTLSCPSCTPLHACSQARA